MPYVDIKMTIWERYFYEEGCDIKDIISNPMSDHPLYSHSDTLYDTMEEMSYEENSNNPTIEVYTDKGELVWTNEPIQIKRNDRIDEIIEKK